MASSTSVTPVWAASFSRLMTAACALASTTGQVCRAWSRVTLQQSVVWCPELLALLGQGGVISTRVLYPGARSADTKKPSGASEIPNQGTKQC